MKTLSVSRVGTVFALAIGGCHLLWAALVASGVAQSALDFVFWMHFINPPFAVVPFDWTRAIALVLITSALGYAAGAVIALLWNATLSRSFPNRP